MNIWLDDQKETELLLSCQPGQVDSWNSICKGQFKKQYSTPSDFCK